jgi:hypothetical protein
MFGLLSNSLMLLVGVNPGQPGPAEPLYASDGPLDEEPRRRPSTDAGPVERSESPDMGRALTKRVNYHGSIFSVSHNGDFGLGNKTRAEEAQAHPRASLPGSLCVFILPDSAFFPTLLHPRCARRCLQLRPLGQFQVSLHLVYRTTDGLTFIFIKNISALQKGVVRLTRPTFSSRENIMKDTKLPTMTRIRVEMQNLKRLQDHLVRPLCRL